MGYLESVGAEGYNFTELEGRLIGLGEKWCLEVSGSTAGAVNGTNGTLTTQGVEGQAAGLQDVLGQAVESWNGIFGG